MYLHELAADENGRSFAAVVTASSDSESSSTSTPASSHTSWNGSRRVRATTWSASNPSNSSVHGRGWHEQRGDLHAIAPQASERKSLTFTVIEGEAAIDGLIARRDALLG